MSFASPGSVAARLLALMLLVVTLGGILLLVVVPLQSWRVDAAERWAQAVETKARLLSILAEGRSQQNLTGGDVALNLSADFLSGTEDALMVAELQTRIRAIVVGQASELSSARSLPTKTVDSLSMVGLRLQIRGEMNSILEILHTLETGTPFLFVERAVLRLEDRRILVADPAEAAAPTLFAELDVFGAKLPPAAAIAKPPVRP